MTAAYRGVTAERGAKEVSSFPVSLGCLAARQYAAAGIRIRRLLVFESSRGREFSALYPVPDLQLTGVHLSGMATQLRPGMQQGARFAPLNARLAGRRLAVLPRVSLGPGRQRASHR